MEIYLYLTRSQEVRNIQKVIFEKGELGRPKKQETQQHE